MTSYNIDGQEFDDFKKFGRRCGCPRPSYVRRQQVDAKMREFREANAAYREAPGTIRIPIQFTHFVDGAAGTVEAAHRREQVDVLNTAYNEHGIEFTYDEDNTRVVDNAAWFRMGHGSSAERAAKTAHQVDPETTLNFYTTNGGGLLGWATFPSDLEGDPIRDGVVVLYSSLPGIGSPPYNLGHTATHEVGHWLGLYHTFQGGCGAVGDHVGDTTPHSAPNYGKPQLGQPHNACDQNEEAPVENYMNYVDDDWMNQFTEGQALRMRDMVGAFRPELLTTSDPALHEACQRVSRLL